MLTDGKDYPILIEYKGYKDKLIKLDDEGNVAICHIILTQKLSKIKKVTFLSIMSRQALQSASVSTSSFSQVKIIQKRISI